MNAVTRIGCGLLCCFATAWAGADTVYVTSSFKVGLHQDKTADSPVVKVVPSGTPLELITRGASVSNVRDSDGTSGWLDNSYLTDTAPAANDKVQDLQKKLNQAQQRIADLEAQAGPSTPGQQSSLQKQNTDLQQQLKEEQLRAGEFQIQLSELRKRVGQNNDNASLYKQIEQLEADKKKLEVQLSSGQGRDGEGTMSSTGSGRTGTSFRLGFSSLAAASGIILLAGFICGVYLMDYLNRRKHGGFRV